MLSSFERRFVVRPRSKKTTAVPDALVPHISAEDNSVAISSLSAERLLGMPSSDAPTYRTMHTTPPITLDPDVVTRCFDTLTEGVPYACLQRLNAELSRAGMQFNSNGAELMPSNDMSTWVDNVLKPIQQDALRAICAIGVVPLAFRRDEATGVITPYVPAPKTYTIAVGTVRGIRFYMLHWLMPHRGRMPIRNTRPDRGPHPDDRLVAERTMGEHLFGVPDPSVVVLHGFNHDPDADGRICSLVMSFLNKAAERAEHFTNSAAVAEAINSNPPILRQYDGHADNARREALRGSEYVGEGVLDPIGEAQARRINNTFLRTDAQIAGYEMQNKDKLKQLATLSGVPIDDNDQVASTVYSRNPRSASASDAYGNPMPWANECALPEQWKTATYHLPTPRHDLVGLLEHFNAQVFFSFLMPPQVLNASARLSADADMAEKTLEVVVSEWRQSIGRVLTFAHDATYLQADVETALTTTIRRNRSQADPSRRDDLRLLVSDNELAEIVENIATVRVTYRTKPTTKAAELDRLLARGIIKWAQYAAAMAQINGIDPSTVEPTDKFPLDAQRIVGLPEYATYLQLQDSRAREVTRHSEVEAARKDAQEEEETRHSEVEAALKDAQDDDSPVTRSKSKKQKTKA